MKYRKLGNAFVLLIETGEEIMEKLLEFCAKEKVFAGSFTGIGAASSVELATFDPEKKEYSYKTIFGQLEITALVGNIAKKGKKHYIHCHITAGDEKFRAFAGHLKSGIGGASCEVTVFPLDGKLERKYSQKTGLNLFDF